MKQEITTEGGKLDLVMHLKDLDIEYQALLNTLTYPASILFYPASESNGNVYNRIAEILVYRDCIRYLIHKGKYRTTHKRN